MKIMKQAAAVTAALTLTGMAQAGVVKSGGLGAATTAILERPAGGIGRNVSPAYDSGGFEPDAGFSIGAIDGQQGWTDNTGGAGPHISDANPSTGSQHVRSSGGVLPAGNLVAAFSPRLDANPNLLEMSIDVNIGGSGGADYDLFLQAPDVSSSVTARIKFYYDDLDGDGEAGEILTVEPDGQGGAEFVSTGVEYKPGIYKTLRAVIDPDAMTIDYFLNDLHIATGAVLGAPMIQEVVLVDDQFQIDESGDWDNLRIVPEPASLAFFGLAFAALIRRRRGAQSAA